MYIDPSWSYEAWTAIYGASLLCVALVSLVSDRRSRVVCPLRARDKVYLVSILDQRSGKEKWEAGRVSYGSEGPDGERTPKVVCSICDTDKASEDFAILRSLAEGRQGAYEIIYSATFSAENSRTR